MAGRPYDGILGLAAPQKCSTGLTPFYRLLHDGFLELPIFSFWFGRTPQAGGYFYLSGTNNDLYEPDLKWMNNVSEHFWMVLMRSVQLGISIYREGCKTLFDTSTPYIVGPVKTIEAMNLQLGGVKQANGLYKIACAKIPSLPTLTFILGEQAFDFALQPSDYTFKLASGCYSYLVGLDLPTGNSLTWVLGYSFLRAWYSAYDADKGAIGLAPSLSY